MQFRPTMGILLAGLCITSALVAAETPNLSPGLWSYTNTLSLSGPFQIPGQTETQQACVTQSDIDQGVDLLETPQSCNISRMDIFHDNMRYAVTCEMQGMTYLMKGQMFFMGSHMKGDMSGQINSPIGAMDVQVSTTAERVGEC